MKLLKKPKIAVYITDQHNEIQRGKLPVNAILGFVVQVYKTDKDGRPKGKAIETFWSKRKEEAENMAQEYHRQYGMMAAFGWK